MPKNLKTPLIIVVVLSFAFGIFFGIRLHRKNLAGQKPFANASLRVLALKGVFPEEFIHAFEERNAIRVHLTELDSPEAIRTRLDSQNSDFDLVTLFAHQLHSASQNLRLQPISPSKLKSFDAIAADFRHVPGLSSATRTVSILWGLSGILHNTSRVPTSPRSWSELLKDSRWKGKIALLSSSADLIQALRLEGSDQAIKGRLDQALGMVKVSAEPLSPASLLLNPEPPWIVQIHHGETAFPPANGKEWRFVFPEEKALLWILSLGLLSNAANVDEAYRFLEDVLRRDSALQITHYVRQASTNTRVEETDLDPRLKPSYLRQVPLTDYTLVKDDSLTLAVRAFLQPLQQRSQQDR